MGLHSALGSGRYYEVKCPYCQDKVELDDTTFTDVYGGQTYHEECWGDLIAERRMEDGDYEP